MNSAARIGGETYRTVSTARVLAGERRPAEVCLVTTTVTGERGPADVCEASVVSMIALFGKTRAATLIAIRGVNMNWREKSC